MTTTAPITSPCDTLVAVAAEAEVRRVMAARVQLKRMPATHAEQSDLVDVIDCLLDQWAEVVADGGQARVP